MLIVPQGSDGLPRFLQEVASAIQELQIPTKPQRLGRVVLSADLPDADDWRECAIICDEINSIVVSTLVTGAYAWKRADGSAL